MAMTNRLGFTNRVSWVSPSLVGHWLILQEDMKQHIRASVCHAPPCQLEATSPSQHSCKLRAWPPASSSCTLVRLLDKHSLYLGFRKKTKLVASHYENQARGSTRIGSKNNVWASYKWGTHGPLLCLDPRPRRSGQVLPDPHKEKFPLQGPLAPLTSFPYDKMAFNETKIKYIEAFSIINHKNQQHMTHYVHFCFAANNHFAVMCWEADNTRTRIVFNQWEVTCLVKLRSVWILCCLGNSNWMRKLCWASSYGTWGWLRFEFLKDQFSYPPNRSPHKLHCRNPPCQGKLAQHTSKATAKQLSPPRVQDQL